MHKQIATILDDAGVTYKVRKHSDFKQEIRSAHDFANALGYDIGRITKTLFVRDQQRKVYALVTCPASAKVDLDQIASHLGVGRIEIAKREELEQITGYPPNGVAPIVPGNFPVIMDRGLFEHKTILIGGGEIGVEIEISPHDLQNVTKASMLSVSLNATNSTPPLVM